MHAPRKATIKASISHPLLTEERPYVNSGRPTKPIDDLKGAYLIAPAGIDAISPDRQDAYSIGVCLHDKRNNIPADGRSHTHPRRIGEGHILYQSRVEKIDFSTPERTSEIPAET